MITQTNIHNTTCDIPEENNGEACIPVDIIKKAQADGNFSMKEILTAQKEYQHWLIKSSGGNISELLTNHTSIGFEFEFATYTFRSSKDKKQYPSHIKLAESENFSPIFNIPFRLETDIHFELEIGMPPLLIAHRSGKINKKSINRIWQKFRETMGKINKDAPGCSIEQLTNSFKTHGMGTLWKTTAQAGDMEITFRRKHKQDQYQVYSQLNIALTGDQIAEFTHHHGQWGYTFPRHQYFAETYSKLHYIITKDLKTLQEKNAAVHISRGLSNLLAIPSLLLLKDEPENRQDEKGVYSAVKETFGIWVKDNLLNLVDHTLTEQPARAEIKKTLLNKRKDLDAVMEHRMEKAMKIVRTQSGCKEEYKTIALTEYTNTMTALHKRLNNPAPCYEYNQKENEFRSESFPAQGKGVRRETYVNIPSPISPRLHLAEIRSDAQIKQFLMY